MAELLLLCVVATAGYGLGWWNHGRLRDEEDWQALWDEWAAVAEAWHQVIAYEDALDAPSEEQARELPILPGRQSCQ